ncbi:tetratricopeptide repeat protein [Sphingomonas qomolangmaensis]|uniref:Cytochrome c biogenesis factor n=1 Tax=Sphingomonas qomolangmaensis TaxID=2918765 RepID=A0ABY5LBI3_9SPHN|nr:hypothetical protein [Sphingomonas qomolangmaensis]UUL83222.1 hypothetical protein NMP03_03035 [Sphingomonas qomolangmaensis]
MGFVTLAFLLAAIVALLWSLRIAPRLLLLAGAVLMLGAAGYALQGRPTLAGSLPDAQAARGAPIDPSLIEIRQQMFGRFQYADTYFTLTDALNRMGNDRGAALAMLGGVRSAPNSLPLWTWLGVTLNQQDGGAMSPAAQLAFRKARSLNPQHPAPWFFQGTALMRAGEFDSARAYWVRALAVSRANSAYRPAIAERIAMLDRFLAMRARMQAEMGGAPGM